MKLLPLLLIFLFMNACSNHKAQNQQSEIQNKIQSSETSYLSYADVISQSDQDEWRNLDLENSLYIELETGTVIVELETTHAPNHVKNTKALAREGLFDNTQFYRVIDGFVAQGGPESIEDNYKPAHGTLTIDSEFSKQFNQPLDIYELESNDGYAEKVGFYKGFAIGQSKDQKESWLLHCYGALGMGRADETDSGGTELYVVIGHAQRYLDKNVTVFGRVIYGMEHMQSLKRSTSLAGPVDLKNHNKIMSIQVASDLKPGDLIPLEILKTHSQSFDKYIQARKNRKEPWFVDSKNYNDVCSIQVPVRIKTQ